MTEDSNATLPPPRTLDRISRPRQSGWPVLLAMGLFALLSAFTAFMLFRSVGGDEPWRINYPGIEWVRGEDSNVKEGKRYLEAEVRFDLDVVSAADLEEFLGALVSQTKKVYVFYHIRALNKRGQWVLDGVAKEDGRFSITPAKDYLNQGAPVPEIPGPPGPAEQTIIE